MRVEVRIEIYAQSDPGWVMSKTRTVEATSFAEAGQKALLEIEACDHAAKPPSARIVGTRGWWRGRMLGGSRGE